MIKRLILKILKSIDLMLERERQRMIKVNKKK